MVKRFVVAVVFFGVAVCNFSVVSEAATGVVRLPKELVSEYSYAEEGCVGKIILKEGSEGSYLVEGDTACGENLCSVEMDLVIIGHERNNIFDLEDKETGNKIRINDKKLTIRDNISGMCGIKAYMMGEYVLVDALPN